MPLSERDRLVIFSDLHMGNRSRRDDFRRNSQLFLQVLQRYYLRHRFRLLLNGDVEELQHYPLAAILRRWPDFYECLAAFDRREALLRVFGNRDYEVVLHDGYPLGNPILEAIRFQYRGNAILVYHGHQASHFQEGYNAAADLLLRYVTRPLGIRRYSVSRSNRRRFKIERRVYQFSKQNRIISIIGHTHRPLFESLSRADSLRFEIERLVRHYPQARKAERERLALDIRRNKLELERLVARQEPVGFSGSLYNSRLLVPCIFNSGAVVGKGGLTAIEIMRGVISLVQWFQRGRGRRYLRRAAAGELHSVPRQLEDTPYYRLVLKRDQLDYIFTRIQLLS